MNKKSRIFNIYIISVLVFLTMLFIINEPYGVKANTPSPTEAETESGVSGEEIATPTPKPDNIVESIGDFKLYGEYIDGSKIEKNVAINTINYGETSITAEIISAVRAQNGNQDIISMIRLELVQNGRPINQEGKLKIYINNETFFNDFENLSLYKINEKEIIENIEIKLENEYIIFETKELGDYVVCGEKAIAEATPGVETNKPLQENEATGIITTNSPTTTPNSAEEGLLTPGGFVFWLIVALIIGLWVGLGIGYILWGRYKSKRNNRGPFVIGE